MTLALLTPGFPTAPASFIAYSPASWPAGFELAPRFRRNPMLKRDLLPSAMVVATLTLLGSPAGAVGQAHRTGIGWAAGGVYVTELNSHPLPGYEPLGARELLPGLGYAVGLHVDKWYGGSARLGFRLRGFYEQPSGDEFTGGRDITTLSGDLSVLLRPLSAAGDAPVLPYLTVGGGGIRYDLGASSTFAGSDASYDGVARVLPLISFGVGWDVPRVWSWDTYPVGLRFEAADLMVLRSPLRRTSDWQRHGSVHHLQFTIGLYSAFGQIR
jgi:hypothetical protein